MGNFFRCRKFFHLLSLHFFRFLPSAETRGRRRAFFEAGNLALQEAARGGMHRRGRAGLFPALFGAGPQGLFDVAFRFEGHRSLKIRRGWGQFARGKNRPRNVLEAVEAFAETGTDGLGIQIEGLAEVLVAEVAEIAELDDFAAGFAQLIEGLMQEGDAFGVHQDRVGAGRNGGRVDGRCVVRFVGLERDGGLAAAALEGLTVLAVIVGLVCGDAEDPGLKLAVALEGIEVLDDGQEDLLADFLRVLPGEIGPQLKNEPADRRVMPVKQFVPGLGITLAAASDQLTLGAGIH